MTPISKRLLVLFLTIAVGMGGVLLLPADLRSPEAGVNMDLPLFIDDWVGVDSPVSEKEIATLGIGTTFARKAYSNAKGDRIFVSIVLSGQDMNTSIHRPERCLPAQGYTTIASRQTAISLEDKKLTAQRLHNKRIIPLRDGREITEYSINYYWFVSSSETTSGHVERNIMDVRDRVLKGYAQPWAFVTVITQITEGLVPFGRNEADTEKLLNGFLQKLVPVIQKDSVHIR